MTSISFPPDIFDSPLYKNLVMNINPGLHDLKNPSPLVTVLDFWPIQPLAGSLENSGYSAHAEHTN